MSSFIDLETFEYVTGFKKSSVHLAVHYYKKEKKEAPPWYKSNGKKRVAYINVDGFFKNSYLIEDVKLYNNIKLCNYLEENLKLTNSMIAAYLCEKSRYYNSYDSWMTFLYGDLFSLFKIRVVYFLKPCLHFEYLRIMYKFVALCLIRERLLFQDGEVVGINEDSILFLNTLIEKHNPQLECDIIPPLK